MGVDLITTEQAAALAGITPATLRKYASRGQSPRPKYTGVALYDADEIRAWLDKRPGQGHRTDLHTQP